jgi:hypothetical protein
MTKKQLYLGSTLMLPMTIMSTTICRYFIEKDAVKPSELPKRTENLREALKDELFKYLRKPTNTFTESLVNTNLNFDKLTFEQKATVNQLILEDWENPSDEDLRAIIEDPECENSWYYEVRDEPSCVTRMLKIIASGVKAPVVGSLASLDQIPGLKYSVEYFNE